MPLSKPYRRTNMQTATSRIAWQALTKVPKLTVYFWIIKLLTTALGESASDYMVSRINPYVAVGIGFSILVATLALQFSVRKYIPWVYWLAALGVSIAGTMGADVIHVALGVPYLLSGLGYAVALAVIFVLWFINEGTLSVHSVHTRKRELFYWAVVLATFALGTALGDLTAYTLHLGYVVSALIFAVIFIFPAISYWRLGLNPILSFWWAYIVTRPLGASIADWMAKTHSIGGLGLGGGRVSIALGMILIGFVSYMTLTGKDLQSKANSF